MSSTRKVRMNVQKKISNIAKKILSDYEYIYDPNHEKNPPPGFHETEKGYSNGEKEKSTSSQAEKKLGDERINWSGNGIGAMPVNRDVDYLGFQMELSADEFRNLTPSGRSSSDLTYIKNSISNGEEIGNPTLFADWNEEQKKWFVTGHEGRSRSDAISELYGKKTLMPVHVIPYKLRARDITEEMIKAPFVKQDIRPEDGKDFVDLFTHDFSHRTKRIKKQN